MPVLGLALKCWQLPPFAFWEPAAVLQGSQDQLLEEEMQHGGELRPASNTSCQPRGRALLLHPVPAVTNKQKNCPDEPCPNPFPAVARSLGWWTVRDHLHGSVLECKGRWAGPGSANLGFSLEMLISGLFALDDIVLSQMRYKG